MGPAISLVLPGGPAHPRPVHRLRAPEADDENCAVLCGIAFPAVAQEEILSPAHTHVETLQAVTVNIGNGESGVWMLTESG